jgi:hypothetical protein
MTRSALLLLTLAILTFGPGGAGATTVVGDLNNFDTLNDTGQVCYGFEIEIDDIHSTDITYTFDWNHYGVPKIREDNADPTHPKVFVRYESAKDSGGAWGSNGSFTNVALPTITPPAGHTCTDTSVNEGCEHFGVGYYGVPTTVRYNWLIDGGAGALVTFGTPVAVGTPTWTYTPPAPAQPAQVVAVIPAPVVPNAAGREFGDPSWVKVIKTTTHNANHLPLDKLISADGDGDGLAEWQNAEPDEVETEWHLLQVNNSNPDKNELAGGADDMGDGSETVTRRYEFYRYGADPDTLDGETGEAMCSEVSLTTDPNDPTYLHGIGDHVAVTDANGDTYYVNCAAQIVVGNYVGAQMAGFEAEARLGLIDNLQDGEQDQPYTPRTVVVGGNSPFTITISQGSLPDGMTLGAYVGADGVLSGTPTASGPFTFTVEAMDASNATVTKQFTLNVLGPILSTTTSEPTTTSTSTTTTTSEAPTTSSTSSTTTSQPPTTSSTTSVPATTTTTTVSPTQRYTLSVDHAGSGKVTSSPKGINCKQQCSADFTVGTSVTLTAKPSKRHLFLGWTGDCSGSATSPTCTVLMLGDRSVGALFD